ncbi:hypothetical protein [Methylobacter sp.]|uniref:hypothetical protein n=1 Tax=Methylobacter sp. TaxID=2051955 RepID=UPI002FDDC8B5
MLTDSSLTDASPVVALDYESLRQQGIAWMEQLAGSEWTDFNAHDPGITILEQVCYALTDLVYRINYDMADLLSRDGEETYDSLYSSQQILVSKPVTVLDLRKLVIDVAGVKNAWIEPVTEPQPPLFYLEKQALETGDQVIDLAGGEGADALVLQGLYRVLIEKSEALDKDSNAIVREVAERLHGQRSLAVDFETIQVIDSQNVQIQTSIEIDTVADQEDVYVAILEKIAEYLSPTVRFYTLEECLAQGKSIDEIFDGPLLNYGFIDSRELIGLKRRKNLYVSDLIQEIMNVSGVRIVEYVVFKNGDKLDDTALVLDAGKIPKLDVRNCRLTLKKRQLAIQLNTEALAERYLNRQKNALQRTPVSPALSLPKGRDRHIERYYSLLHQFPKVYGIGATGLSSTVSEERKAQAKQLKAYLLLFDQLLANSFAQLANLKDLFSFSCALPTDSNPPISYFAACLDAPDISDLWVEQNNDARLQNLQQIFGASQPNDADTQQAADWQRKNRFIDHLLARFAEQFIDYSGFGNHIDARKPVLESKLTLLGTYTQISSSKGTGFNVLAGSSPDNRSGLEHALRLKLGLLETSDEQLYVIEHALLRPMVGDSLQQGSLLCNARSQDPYSLQLSVVVFAASWRSKDFKRFVEQTVREETPAHLVVYVCWLAVEEGDGFAAAYQNWQQQHLAYRMQTNQRILNGSIDQSAAILLRDARDRLIDRLAIGHTYPLRDLAIADVGTVAYNMKARIVISCSQQDVSYRLCDNQQQPLVPEIKQQGNGGDLELISPAIVNDRSFTIQATKAGSGLSTFLLETPTVKVGLDLTLTAGIQNAPLLLPSPTPAANDAKIVDYGVKIQVAIDKAQEGVDYQLIKIEGKTETALSLAVRGDSKTIILETKDAVTEDIDIRIRATKTFDKSEKKATQTDLLITVLPLKVRANPVVVISVTTPIVDYSSAADIKIQASQASARYQALTRRIADNEFIHGAATGTVLTIVVPKQEAVQLRLPTTAGFAVVTDAAQGNGGDLHLSCANLTADSFIAIQAVKNHLANTGETLTSTVEITQITAVLVRPDANPALRFNAGIADSLLQSPIQVSGGQAGVFYEFTTVADSKVQGLPVYFHQLDHLDNTQNKGVGQLQIGVDLATSPAVTAERLKAHQKLANLPPEPPELSANASIKSDAQLSIRAIKAQTRVEAVFKRTVSSLLT